MKRGMSQESATLPERQLEVALKGDNFSGPTSERLFYSGLLLLVRLRLVALRVWLGLDFRRFRFAQLTIQRR